MQIRDKLKLFKLLSIVIFLNSCATNYSIPETKESASIRIYADPETIGKGVIPIGAYTNEECDAKGGGRISYLYTKSSINLGPKSRDSLEMFDEGFVSFESKYETKIPANEPFIFILGVSSSDLSSTGAVTSISNQSCYVTLSFIPEKDAQYEAKYVGNHLACDGKVFKLLKSSETGKVTRNEIKAKKLNCHYPGNW